MSPHLNHMGLAVNGLILATKAKSSSSATLLLLVGFGLLVYLFVLRPRSQKARRAQMQNKAAGVGDEVMLTSGIIGRVTSVEGDRATVEIAPEIEVEVVRRAIGQILQKADDETPLDVPPDPGSDDYVHDGPDAMSGRYNVEGEGDGEDPSEGEGEDADPKDDESGEDAMWNDTASHAPEPGPGAALDLGEARDLGEEGRKQS